MDDYEKIAAVFYDAMSEGVPGDVDFFVEEAKKAGSPVLELGCGTGRVLIPTAEAGVDIVGLDLSPDMLAIAKEKVSRLDDDVQERIKLIQGDMVNFSLDQKFNLITIPFRAFQHVMTPEDQRKALVNIGNHLNDGGRLIIDIFDPRLDFITDKLSPAISHLRDFKHPVNGHKVVFSDTLHYDPLTQALDAYFIFEELDDDNSVISKTYAPLTLRWSYRWEMQYLFELAGFEVEALYGDFARGPFRHGAEQIWVVRK